MKVHANNFIEPPQEENQDQMPMTNQGSFMTFLVIWGITEILYSFRLVLEGNILREITELLRLDLSRLGFLKKFLAKNVALSVEEDKISGLLNRGGIADLALL